MVLSKKEIISRKLVTETISPLQFQPAGVDLTVKEVYDFLSSFGRIDLDNSERQLPDTQMVHFLEDDWIFLPKGPYKIVYNEIVHIPSDCAGFAFPRSSLLRCGVNIQCAVWDPGYEGRSESLLVVENPNGVKLKRNARIVQLVFMKLSGETGETYSGKYNKENIK